MHNWLFKYVQKTKLYFFSSFEFQSERVKGVHQESHTAAGFQGCHSQGKTDFFQVSEELRNFASSQENSKQSGNFSFNFSVQKFCKRFGKGNIVSKISTKEFISAASSPALLPKDLSWMVSKK